MISLNKILPTTFCSVFTKSHWLKHYSSALGCELAFLLHPKGTKYSSYKHPTKRYERHCSNYVNRIRNQFIIKETEKNCTEAIENGLFLFYHKGNPLVSKDKGFTPIFADRSKIEEYVDQSLINHDSAFLSISDEEYNHRPLFAVALPKELEEKKLKSIENTFGGAFTNLRLAILSGEPGCNILSNGYSLLKWLHNTKFCSKCGSVAEKNTAGSRVTCSNQNCGVIFYPPTSPVGIVLVASSNHSHVLLVRQPKYPVGMYSCIAGFVDMGETLYECVKREVAEEAGIEVLPHSGSNFKVLSSQHWPFPNGSLMTGCLALATGPEDPGAVAPKIDSHGEIENVKWFEVHEIVEALNRINKNPMLRMTVSDENIKASDIFVPPKGAIAHQLLKMWLVQYHNIDV